MKAHDPRASSNILITIGVLFIKGPIAVPCVPIQMATQQIKCSLGKF